MNFETKKNTKDRCGMWEGGVFFFWSILKSLISTCVLSYVGSRRKERIGYLTESASLKRTAGIV